MGYQDLAGRNPEPGPASLPESSPETGIFGRANRPGPGGPRGSARHGVRCGPNAYIQLIMILSQT
jgi:hypothetical protein